MKDKYDVRIMLGDRGPNWVAMAAVCRNYDHFLYAAMDLPSYAEASKEAGRLNDIAKKVLKEARIFDPSFGRHRGVE